jgi:hypothetical protein
MSSVQYANALTGRAGDPSVRPPADAGWLRRAADCGFIEA